MESSGTCQPIKKLSYIIWGKVGGINYATDKDMQEWLENRAICFKSKEDIFKCFCGQCLTYLHKDKIIVHLGKDNFAEYRHIEDFIRDYQIL